MYLAHQLHLANTDLGKKVTMDTGGDDDQRGGGEVGGGREQEPLLTGDVWE